MYLMDCVVQSSPGVRIDDFHTGRQILMPGAGMFSEEVSQVPVRYILDDAVAATCAEMVVSRHDFLSDALDIVRAPYGSFWLEWNEHIRTSIFSTTSLSGSQSSSARAGLLVNMDETGRAGILRIFWSEDGQFADVNPAMFHFDLDRLPNIGSVMDVRAESASLQALFDHVWIDFDPDWKAYYRLRARSDAHFGQLLSKVLGPAAFDFPFFVAFSLLVMANSHAVIHSDLSALNRNRARKGRPALLEHVTVTQRIQESETYGRSGLADTDRAAPRLHLVRGHLVRRGDKVFWRNSHFRGQTCSAPLRRTICLELGKAA